MALLNKIRTFGRAFGIDLKRYSPLRRAVDMLVARGGDPFFIQVGANNGTDFDNLYEAVTSHRLSGIVVEPVADYYDALRLAYSRYPNIIPIRAAIHPSASTMIMYRVAPDRAEHLWQHGIASFDRQHLLNHGVLPSAIVEEEVPCLSMADLLDRVPTGRSVDLFATDTEGFDAEILRMLNIPSVRPKVMRFEDKHMAPNDRRHFDGLLKANGYDLDYLAGDCIAIDHALARGPLDYLRANWNRARY